MKQMTAQAVLQRYHNGERDFRRVNLRGLSFKGQNLAGADFSEADIRSTNFAKANLSHTNFSGAIGGIQTRWWLVQQLLALIIAALSSFLSAFSGAWIAAILFYQSNDASEQITYRVAGVVTLLILAVTMLSIARQGFNTKILTSIAGVVVVAGAGVVVVARAGAVAGVVAVAGAVAGVIAGAGAGAVAVAVVVYSVYIAWETRKGNEKFSLLRTWSNAFGAIGGTSFGGADLTGSNFKQTVLKSTNLQTANFTQVSWHDAKNHDLARWGASVLANEKVRQLLMLGNGAGRDYQNIDLSGVNLEAANLTEANLTHANLSRSTLRYANLKNANLRETLCVDTDFTGVDLTGACIQAWNIDHTTKLDRVECQYVFLLARENTYGSRERRPHDPDKVFEPGDFEQLYRKIITTVELLLRGGINSQAFADAFDRLMRENPEISRDSIEFKKVGDDVKITLEVPIGTDKGKIERSFDEFYTAKLEAAKANALLATETKHNNDLKDIITAIADKSPITDKSSNVTINNTAMNDSNKPNISAGANSLINTGKIDTTGSTINLGTISGAVTNTINQLPNNQEGEESNLKELLTQLQQAIQTDAELPNPDKEDLLEEVQNLATAGQTETPAEKERLTRKAKKMFDATLDKLPDTAKIAEAVSKLLPIILKILGMSV